jgi:hypothetical protein
MDKLPEWPQKPTKRDWPDAHWEDVAYERARAEAASKRLRDLHAATLVFSHFMVDVADGMSCDESESDCKRCQIYDARRKLIETLNAIGELPKEGE